MEGGTRGGRGRGGRVKSTDAINRINYHVPHSRIFLIQEERGRNGVCVYPRTQSCCCSFAVFSVVIVQSVVVTKIISSQNFNFFLFGGVGAI